MQPRPAGACRCLVDARLAERGELAQGEGEVLREAVVDVGGEAATLPLHLGVLQALAQARGGDAGIELLAEQRQHGGAHRVER